MTFIEAEIPDRIPSMDNPLHLLIIKQLIIPFRTGQINFPDAFPLKGAVNQTAHHRQKPQ